MNLLHLDGRKLKPNLVTDICDKDLSNPIQARSNFIKSVLEPLRIGHPCERNDGH
ncbi:protein of unknown function [Magnetospirillum sp. XM-1]|nr:protein of unknown function [Magnetospirillum sp. XM-1]